jgi:hypothetical protein
MGVHLLQTYFGHRIQLLHQQATKMWLYPRPSYHDHPFSEELGDVEINTQIHKVLAHGVDQNLGVGSPEGRGRRHQGELIRIRLWKFEQFYPLIVIVSMSRVSCMLTVRHGASM